MKLILQPSQEGWQLRDIDRDPPRLIAGQSAHSHAPAGFVFVINIRERLSFGVADAERLGGFVELPGRVNAVVAFKNETGTMSTVPDDRFSS